MGRIRVNAITFLTIHTSGGQKRMVPRLSSDCVEGKHAAILEPGETVLPPILCTANVPSRFTCYLKGTRPVDVIAKLGDRPASFQVGTEWKRFEMTFTPPNPLMGVFPASLKVPPGVTVLADAEISFHPLLNTGRR